MSFLAPFLIRTLGPVTALACAGALLAPLMSQPSRVYRTTDIVQMIGGQIWPSLLVIALTIVFATAVWLPLAVLTARRGYHAGLTVAPVSILAQAMAPFWIALVVLLLFGPMPRQAAQQASLISGAVLPASALAVVLLGFLAHATYLRAVSRQALAAESDEASLGTSNIGLEIVHDWLDTIGRQAGLLIGALVLIEMVFSSRGLGRLFVDGLMNADLPFRAVALFDLIALSCALTVMFGTGAELVRARLERRQATSARILDDSAPVPQSSVPSEPRWLAVVTVALGGLILTVLLILATSPGGYHLSQSSAVLLPPGTAGYPFGTNPQGRDVQALIGAAIRMSVQEIAWFLFAAALAIPCGLVAARSGQRIEAAWSMLIDGVLTVSPILLAVSWRAGESPIVSHQVAIGAVMVAVFVRLIRDAVRAVWPGERRNVPAVFGAILMGLFVGLGYAIVLDATLGFLGLGIGQMPAQSLGELVSWGLILASKAPWLVVTPGIVLTALVASLIFIGYGSLGLLRSCPPRSGMPTEEVRLLAEA